MHASASLEACSVLDRGKGRHKHKCNAGLTRSNCGGGPDGDGGKKPEGVKECKPTRLHFAEKQGMPEGGRDGSGRLAWNQQPALGRYAAWLSWLIIEAQHGTWDLKPVMSTKRATFQCE